MRRSSQARASVTLETKQPLPHHVEELFDLFKRGEFPSPPESGALRIQRTPTYRKGTWLTYVDGKPWMGGIEMWMRARDGAVVPLSIAATNVVRSCAAHCGDATLRNAVLTDVQETERLRDPGDADRSLLSSGGAVPPPSPSADTRGISLDVPP